MRQSRRTASLQVLLILLPRVGLVVLAATLASLLFAAFEARGELRISAVEISNSLFRSLVTAAFTLLVWGYQETRKFRAQKDRAGILLNQVQEVLRPALAQELSQQDAARIRQDIRRTNIHKDLEDLRDTILQLTSLGLMPHEAMTAATGLRNALQQNGALDSVRCEDALAVLRNRL
jgi:hypothetical protein